MSRGWRVQLRDGIERGRDGVKVNTGRPYGTPFLCGQCGTVETTKHLHLDLDAANSRIVSDGVAAELQACGAIGLVFEVTNEVVSPPPLMVRVGTPTVVGDFRLVLQ